MKRGCACKHLWLLASALITEVLVQGAVVHAGIKSDKVSIHQHSQEQGLRLLRNGTLNGSHHSAIDYGSPVCMKWTGGTCYMGPCKQERGNTECSMGKCLCAVGHCANALGICEPGVGKDIGAHSIQFASPFVANQRYLGIETATLAFGGEIEVLGTVTDANAQWKMFETPHGFVRIESAFRQGHMLVIDQRRRRSGFMQMREPRPLAEEDIGSNESRNESRQAAKAWAKAYRAHGAQMYNASRVNLTTGRIYDDDDLVPSLKPFASLSPVEVTWQVRWTTGGLELWYPRYKVSLACTDRTELFQDLAADHGVAECRPGGCQQRELVVFQPPLPAKSATSLSTGARMSLTPLDPNYIWNSILWGLFLFGLFICVVCLQFSSL